MQCGGLLEVEEAGSSLVADRVESMGWRMRMKVEGCKHGESEVKVVSREGGYTLRRAHRETKLD